jgi:hypothetical protein
MNERQARNARREQRLQKINAAREELDAAIYRFLPEYVKLTDVIARPRGSRRRGQPRLSCCGIRRVRWARPGATRWESTPRWSDPFTVLDLINTVTEAIGQNLPLIQNVWEPSKEE